MVSSCSIQTQMIQTRDERAIPSGYATHSHHRRPLRSLPACCAAEDLLRCVGRNKSRCCGALVSPQCRWFSSQAVPDQELWRYAQDQRSASKKVDWLMVNDVGR